MFGTPKFSGKPLEWSDWYSMFDTVVASSGITASEKMAHLQSCLTGNAKAAIQGFGFNGNLFTTAMNELKSRYGNPRIIVDAHLDKIMQSKTPTFRDPSSVIDFYTTVNVFVKTLQVLNFQGDLTAACNLRLLVDKLSSDFLIRWNEYLADNLITQPTIVYFSDWLKKLSDISHQLPATVSRSPQKVNSYNTETKPFTRECLLGKDCGPHFVQNSPKFRKMSVVDRRQLIKDKRACFNCFRLNCSVLDCKSELRCRAHGCGKKHHTLLHFKNVQEHR